MTNNLITKWLDNQNDTTKKLLTKYLMGNVFNSSNNTFKFIEDTSSGLYLVYFANNDLAAAVYDSEDESFTFLSDVTSFNLDQLYDLVKTGKNFKDFL